MATTINGTTGIDTIQDNTVTSAKISNGAVTATDLASTLDLTGKTVTLPAGVGGKVLQVVQAVYDSSFSSSSSTYADTGLTATITPSSSSNKVLVIVNHANLYKDDDGSGAAINIRLVKNGSTVIKVFLEGAAFTGTTSKNGVAGTAYTYLDSPATTSAITYKTQMANRGASGTAVIQANSNTLTLMEIAV